MSSFDAFVGKLSHDNIHEMSDYYGTAWDEDSVTTICRRCDIEFTVLIRKHHCRECGGIFCQDCALDASYTPEEVREMAENEEARQFYAGKYAGRKNPHLKSSRSSTAANEDGKTREGWYPGKYMPVARAYRFIKRKVTEAEEEEAAKTSAQGIPSGRGDSSTEENNLICIGCRYGETPGPRVRGFLKEKYKEYRQRCPTEPLCPPSTVVALERGSLYGTNEGDKLMKRQDGQPAHESGYLEILNKSDFVCAVRLCEGGSEGEGNFQAFREACRPSYMTVLPQQCIHAVFDPSTPTIALAVLYCNVNRYTPETADVVYNTRAEGIFKSDISPSCLVENFTEIVLYSIPSAGRNIVLKYQGQGLMELRRLTTTKVGRGALGALKSAISRGDSGSQRDLGHTSTFDFSTNASDLVLVTSSLSLI